MELTKKITVNYTDISNVDAINNDIIKLIVKMIPKHYNKMHICVLCFLGGTDFIIDGKIGTIIHRNYTKIINDIIVKQQLFPIIFNGATNAGHINILNSVLDKHVNKYLSFGFTTGNYKKYDINATLIQNNHFNFTFGFDFGLSDFGIETKFLFGTIQQLLKIQKFKDIKVMYNFVNGGKITAKEFFYAAMISHNNSEYILHKNTGRFTHGLISSIGKNNIVFDPSIENTPLKDKVIYDISIGKNGTFTVGNNFDFDELNTSHLINIKRLNIVII